MSKPSKLAIEMHKLAIQCAKSLMEKQGKTEDEATKEVCKYIEDSSNYEPDMIMASMKMNFLDESVTEASQEIIKDILK